MTTENKPTRGRPPSIKSTPTPKEPVAVKTSPDCHICGTPMQKFTNFPTAFFCNSQGHTDGTCEIGAVNSDKMANSLISPQVL